VHEKEGLQMVITTVPE